MFYLDNMEYGAASLQKGHVPRIELYDERTLSKQIMAETTGLRGQTPCRMFGVGKVKIIFTTMGHLLNYQFLCTIKVHPIQ